MAVTVTAVSVVAGCTSDVDRVVVSGSSTVLPISQRVAELWDDTGTAVVVDVDGPGTGDGFKLFCEGEVDVADASRPIKPAEIDDCAANGIEFIELKVAYDGLAVVTNADNESVTCLSKEDLYALVGPESQGIGRWRDAEPLARELGSSTELPDEELEITGPGEESGTFDTFVELVIAGIAERRVDEGHLDAADAETTRPDYNTQSNDNVTLQAVEGASSPLAWIGYAYAQHAGGDVKLLEVRNDDGECVAPAPDTIADGSYPLSRSLYIYVNAATVETDPGVAGYVDFYLGEGLEAVSQVGYVPLPDAELAATVDTWTRRRTGTREERA